MIRPYRPSDLERLKEITVVCFDGVSIDQNIEREVGLINGRDWRWRKARHIDADAAAHPDGIFVFEEDGEIWGYVTSRIDTESRVGSIPNIAVLPGRQGRGAGRALMDAVLAYLKAAGMEYVRIETLNQNPIGSAFYPSAGFQEVARQIHYVKKL